MKTFPTRLIYSLLMLLLLPVYSAGQQLLTLKQCYESAALRSELSSEKASYSSITGLKRSNLMKGWLPAADLNGSILYNSSVADIGSALGAIPVPGLADAIKPLPHDQYKVTIDINQVIYDGGAVKSALILADAEQLVNEKQSESDIYRLRPQVNNLYFGILLAGRQKELLSDYLELLVKKSAAMKSAFENGVILSSDLDIIESEKLKLIQQLDENEIRKKTMQNVLSDLTGISISDSTRLTIPETLSSPEIEIMRPELQLFDLRKNQLQAGSALISSRRMPKAFGFASLGYGNPPGSNFFRDEFDTYYIIGAGIKWNIFDWNKSKNEKKVISMEQDILAGRKADLSDNLKRQLEMKQSEIDALIRLVDTDAGIITLRKKISASSESQYNNGTITATEYLGVLNSEKQAELNLELHSINLALARVEYINITGNDPE